MKREFDLETGLADASETPFRDSYISILVSCIPARPDTPKETVFDALEDDGADSALSRDDFLE